MALNKQEKLALENLVKKFLSKMSFQNAILHFEVRCRPESLYNESNFNTEGELINENSFFMPIEINMRMGGAETWSMVKASYDIDLCKEQLNIILGYKIYSILLNEKVDRPRFQSVSNNMYPKKNGYMNSLSIDYTRLKELDVVEIFIFIGPDKKRLLKQDDFIGWISVKDNFGSSLSLMKEKLNQAIECIHVEYGLPAYTD